MFLARWLREVRRIIIGSRRRGDVTFRACSLHSWRLRRRHLGHKLARQRVVSELIRRGGATTHGSQMAATRRVASRRAARGVIAPQRIHLEYASSLFLAFGPSGRNADATSKLNML